MPNSVHLECAGCGYVAPARLESTCPGCGQGLEFRYDLQQIKASREQMQSRSEGVWRYRELLPHVPALSLGEASTPLVPVRSHALVWIKDEGANPAGSIVARGLAVAISAAKAQGLPALTYAGDPEEAPAFAAYAAAAGVKARIALAAEAPPYVREQCELYGAELRAQDSAKPHVSSATSYPAVLLPYVIEGLKTLGYEIAEQLGWTVPDAVLVHEDEVLYRALCKSFETLVSLGWIESAPQIYVAVAAKDESTKTGIKRHEVAVTSADELATLQSLARDAGLLLSPRGARAFAAYETLLRNNQLNGRELIVIVNPTSGAHAAGAVARQLGLQRPALPKSRSIGGIIQPY